LARLYANENYPLPIVEELRRLGHDVLTTLDAGKSGQAIDDMSVLQFACSQQRAVITHNRKHFIRLHNLLPDHFGIVVCTFDTDFRRQAQLVHEELQAQPDLSRQLLRVNRPSKI